MSKTLSLLVFSTLVCGAAVAAEVAASDEQALLQRSRDWSAAASARDLDRILAFWADDAVVLPPGQPPIEGKAAIREFVETSLAIPGFSITWEPESASISPSGDLGYLIEKNRVTVPGASGEPVTIPGKAVTIWRKDDAGEWKCVVDIWNEEPAGDAPEAAGAE